MSVRCNIFDFEGDDIAAAQLAVDGQAEHCQFQAAPLSRRFELFAGMLTGSEYAIDGRPCSDREGPDGEPTDGETPIEQSPASGSSRERILTDSSPIGCRQSRPSRVPMR
jgi:hypothetical protein